jgi:predicted DNA-binding transcriptional regulator
MSPRCGRGCGRAACTRSAAITRRGASRRSWIPSYPWRICDRAWRTWKRSCRCSTPRACARADCRPHVHQRGQALRPLPAEGVHRRRQRRGPHGLRSPDDAGGRGTAVLALRLFGVRGMAGHGLARAGHQARRGRLRPRADHRVAGERPADPMPAHARPLRPRHIAFHKGAVPARSSPRAWDPMPGDAKRTAGIPTAKLVIVLVRAYRSLAEFLEGGLALQGISLRDFAILEVLLHKGPLPAAAIASKMQLRSAAMRPAVDRLNRRGLIRRRLSSTQRICRADGIVFVPVRPGFQVVHGHLAS